MRTRRIYWAAGLLLMAPLFAGCGDRQSEESGSQPPASQSRPNAPPMFGQSGPQNSTGTPEKDQSEQSTNDNSARDQKPEDRG